MKLQARNVPPPGIGPRIAELHDAVNCPEERNPNGARWYRGTCSFGRPWNAAESPQRQTCKLSLTLSESTTRDGLRLASRTPHAASRPGGAQNLQRFGWAHSEVFRRAGKRKI